MNNYLLQCREWLDGGLEWWTREADEDGEEEEDEESQGLSRSPFTPTGGSVGMGTGTRESGQNLEVPRTKS